MPKRIVDQPRVEQQVRVAEHNPLGQRRGAGSVLKKRHGIWSDVGRLPSRGRGKVDGLGRQFGKAAKHGVPFEAGLKFGQERGGGQHQAGAAVGGNGRQSRRRPPRTRHVHGHGRDSRIEASQQR